MTVYVESTLSKLNQDDLIHLALDIQETQNSILSYVKNEPTELRKNENKLETDLKVSKSVTKEMKCQIVVLEHKRWSFEQYSRCECLESFGIPSDTEASKFKKNRIKNF